MQKIKSADVYINGEKVVGFAADEEVGKRPPRISLLGSFIRFAIVSGDFKRGYAKNSQK